MRRTRGAKDELVEELRNRVRSVECRLDEAEASRRRADHIIAQLTRTTEEQARAIRELEAPVDEPEKDRRRSTGDRVSDPDAQQRVRTSGKPPKVGDLGLPKQTAFTSLVPLPAGYRLRFDPEADPELYPGAKDADGLESSPVPPDLLLNAGRVQDGLLIMLLGAGVLVATGATALDLLVTPATILGGVHAIFTLRLLATVAFGFYVGMKVTDLHDRLVSWTTLHIIGLGMGGFAAGTVLLLSRIDEFSSGGGSEPFYQPFLTPEYIANIVFTYLVGTWLLFISGAVLGKVVQFKAEQDRWGVLSEPQSGSIEGSVPAGNTRSAVILGFVGVIGGALLQSIGQIVAALVGQ